MADTLRPIGQTTDDPMDMADKQATYRGFLVLTKWGTIVVVAVLVLLALFLV